MSGAENQSRTVSEQLLAAMNAHDIDSHVACFAEDYRSEQPAHPSRTFTGRDQVQQNWSRLFDSIPDSNLSSSGSLLWGIRSGVSGFGGGPRKTEPPGRSVG
jgi:SnoaL-like domain